MQEEGYTIKEILNEMRKENRENFLTINAHLSQLNGKVATHVQLIAELQKHRDAAQERLDAADLKHQELEKKQASHAVMYGIAVFFATLVAIWAFNKLFG